MTRTVGGREVRWCAACSAWWPAASPWWRVVPAGTAARAERPYVRRTDVWVCRVHGGYVGARSTARARAWVERETRRCLSPSCMVTIRPGTPGGRCQGCSGRTAGPMTAARLSEMTGRRP